MLVIDQDSRPACRREDRRPGHIQVSFPEPSGAAISPRLQLGCAGPLLALRLAPGPSSESLQGRNPREIGQAARRAMGIWRQWIERLPVAAVAGRQFGRLGLSSER